MAPNNEPLQHQYEVQAFALWVLRTSSANSQQDRDESAGRDLLAAQTLFSLDFNAKQTSAAEKQSSNRGDINTLLSVLLQQT